MYHSLLHEYTIWYEWALPHVDGVLPILACVLFTALSVGVVWARGFDGRSIGFLALNVAAASFVLSTYLVDTQRGLLLCCIILLCAYVLAPSPQKPNGSPATKGHTWIALLVIATSTALKLVELDSLPPLLNDYGARTGVEAYSQFAEAPWRWVFTKANPYLLGGGTSVLHAPLVMLSFELFGYSIYAVRFAEVLGSIAVLSFFWVWLRALGAGAFSLVALVLFAFSSEHLATSRVGTFYSVSQALALCILWLTTRLYGRPQRYTKWLLGLFLAIVLLRCAYGPVRVLFVYSGIALLALAVRHGGRFRTRGALISLCVIVVAITFLNLNKQVPFKTFTRPTDILATDSPIWFKVGDQVEFSRIQSLEVIVSNFVKNCRQFFQEALAPNEQRERFYEVGIAVLLCYAVFGVWTPRWRVCSAYVICGFVPLLVTFPLLRRGIVIRPLIPALLALLMKEYVLVVQSAFQSKSVRIAVCSALGLLACILPVQGIYFFAKYNSPIGMSPSFGPLHARNLYDHLKILLKEQRVVVLDPGYSDWQYKMEFAELFMRTSPEGPRLILADVWPDAPLSEQLPKDRPLKVAVLNESRQAWAMPALQQQFANLSVEEFREGGNVLFWIVTINHDDGSDSAGNATPKTSESGVLP